MRPPPFLAPISKGHGSKTYLARRIVASFPAHDVYVEPYGGYASVLINKPRSRIEHYNELDPKRVAVMRTAQKSPSSLARLLSEQAYSEETWNRACETDTTWDGNDGHLEAVVAYIVKHRMSRGGLGNAFSSSTRLRGGQNEGKNAWENNAARVGRVSDRLQSVLITNEDAVEVIWRYSACEDGLVYADPPYMLKTRTVRKVYAFELARKEAEDRAQHAALALALHSGRFAVALSGYRSSEYDQWFGNWNRLDIDIANHSSQSKKKQRRIECLWSRPRLAVQGATPVRLASSNAA